MSALRKDDHKPAAAKSARKSAVVLVVEDEWIVARDLQQTLIGGGYDVPHLVTRVEHAFVTAREIEPDLTLLDIALGRGKSGLELASELRDEGLPFMFVSAHADTAMLAQALRLGPSGFVVKPFSSTQLLAAVAIALSSRPAMAPPHAGREAPELNELSAREREVLHALLAHKRPPAIARELFISPFTVRNHLKSIYSKLGVSSQQELLDKLLGRSER